MMRDTVHFAMAEVIARRRAMIDRGFLPIPLYGNKNPALKGWPDVVADEKMILRPYWQKWINTGIITKKTPVIDVDIGDEVAAKEIEALIHQRYGSNGKVLRRVGKPPKFAVPFKTDEPFKKKFLSVWPPGMAKPKESKDCQKIEILGDGQQAVVDGIHPKTKLPYSWSGGEPWTVARDELPELTGEEADAFLAAARELLVSLGWGVWEKEESKRKKIKKRPADSDSKWQKLNSAALANLDAWVPEIFPDAEPCRGGYRVTSAMLDRDLEEDLSLMPEGIKDFGIHDMGDEKEGKRTPIDVVMEYGKKDFKTAVDWLQERLGFQDGVTLKDFCANMPQHNYVYMPTREPWPSSSVNARLGKIPVLNANGNPVMDDDGSPKEISASLWLDQNRPVEQMTWCPGLPELISNLIVADGGWIERPDVTILNLYRPPRVELGDAKLATPWLDHIRKVYPNDAGHIIPCLAHRVQRPQEKINHAIVLGGKPGIGKDTLLDPVKYATGAWDFSEISPQQLIGRFNGFIKSVILRISEARDLGDLNSWNPKKPDHDTAPERCLKLSADSYQDTAQLRTTNPKLGAISSNWRALSYMSGSLAAATCSSFSVASARASALVAGRTAG